MPSILQGRDRKPPMSAPADEHMPEHEMDGGDGGEMRSTLVSRGDGTHHIEHEDGSMSEHPHIGHALMHLAGKHSDGKHHHTHSDGMGGGHTVHTSEHGGEPEGPHDHENLESVKKGMDQFFNEEENESDWGEGKEAGKDGKEGKDY